MNHSDYGPWILAVLMLVSVAVLGWLAWKSIREHGARHEEAIALQKEAIALYRHSIESSQSSEQLQLESNALLRELIGELRASRAAIQATSPPDRPPASA